MKARNRRALSASEVDRLDIAKAVSFDLLRISCN